MHQELIQQVQEANDLVDVVSQYLPLKQAGRNFKALCPFHQEKTPSFTVSPEKQLFYCFGCQKGGNVFHFVMAMEQITFGEALRMLAKRAGISLETESEGKEAIYLACETAAYFYHKNLWEKRWPQGRKYLQTTHVTSD